MTGSLSRRAAAAHAATAGRKGGPAAGAAEVGDFRGLSSNFLNPIVKVVLQDTNG